jgi:Acetyltransferase (GNAT) family
VTTDSALHTGSDSVSQQTNRNYTELSFKGRRRLVPAVRVAGRTVVLTGRLIRIATVQSADYVEGGSVMDPEEVRRALAGIGRTADIFTFTQNVGDEEPRFPYYHEWDNAAAVSSADYDRWWKGLSEHSRRNVRLASKRGVTVEVANFDDKFVKAIKSLYDETPVRTGRLFWHYGKDLETIRKENSSFLDRSEFLGAFHGEQLIGFMKFVYVGNSAQVMQFLLSQSHLDKKAGNALIAKAMEICHRKGMAHLIYCKFTYGAKKPDSLAEFKRRNGFVEVKFPQYFVPFTMRGRIILALKLHRGIQGILPAEVIQVLLRIRSGLLHLVTLAQSRRHRSLGGAPIGG